MLKRELFLSNNSGTITCGGTEKLQAEHWIEIATLKKIQGSVNLIISTGQ